MMPELAKTFKLMMAKVSVVIQTMSNLGQLLQRLPFLGWRHLFYGLH